MIKKALFIFALLAMTAVGMQAQSLTISGVVRGTDSEPIIGANIVEKGTTNGIITDTDGRFTLTVAQGAKIVVTFVGYETLELPASATMSITLREDAEVLDEVVVVGYGTQKKANLTGAVSTVDVGKQLDSKSNTDIARALQGAVPGLTITNSTGRIDDNPTIQIRGVGTLSNDAVSNPLIVVDGVPMDDISYLNANDIESVSVLKDAASTSIYGTRAAFGVLLIQTKGAKKQDKVTVTYSNNFSWQNPTYLFDYPTVSQQGAALYQFNTRAGNDSELFGIYMTAESGFFKKADEWLARHGGKSGYREMVYGDDFDDKGYYADWDVFGIMFRKWRPAQNHNVSVAGSSEHINYYLSFGYDHQESVLNFNPSKRDKYNINMNLTSNITKWLQVGTRMQLNKKDYSYPDARRNIYQYMLRWGSYFEPLGYVTIDGKQYDGRNSIAYLKQSGQAATNNYYTRMSAFAKLTPFKGLTINADFTYNIENNKTKYDNYKVVGYNNWALAPSGGFTAPSTFAGTNYVAVRNTNGTSYALNVFGTYETTFAASHNLKIMLGGNKEEGESARTYVKRETLLDETLPELNLAVGSVTADPASNYHRHWGTAGFFARINYDWKGIALLELNGRADGSSKFPADSRWAFFPSGSVGYRMSEQEFWSPIKDKVSNVKLRASFGQIGNQEIGTNMFISTISSIATSDVYWVGEGSTKYSAYGIPSLVAADLSWERIQTLDIGLDLGFFQNELNVSFDWYQRNTKDMLAPSKTLPAVLGASAPRENAGELRTRGWELNIDYRHTFHEIGDLTVYGAFNLSDYKTEVAKWDNDNPLLNTNYTGKVVGDIWGFETERFFTTNDFTWDADGYQTGYAAGVPSQEALESGSFTYEPGDVKFKDLNGDGVINWGEGTKDDHGDLKKIGNSTPRYQYGIRLGVEWKGFDLDLYFQGVGQRQMWQWGESNLMLSNGANGIYDTQTDYYGAYDNELITLGRTGSNFGKLSYFQHLEANSKNLNAFYPSPYAGNNGQGAASSSILTNGRYNFYPQTKYLLNAAYCRFKNLTLGYTIPQEYTKKAYVQKLRVYFTAENLCELFNGMKRYKIDPEITGSESSTNANGTFARIDPMNRSLAIGLQITF